MPSLLNPEDPELRHVANTLLIFSFGMFAGFPVFEIACSLKSDFTVATIHVVARASMLMQAQYWPKRAQAGVAHAGHLSLHGSPCEGNIEGLASLPGKGSSNAAHE